MPLDPWFPPGGPVDRLGAYFWATLSRSVYAPLDIAVRVPPAAGGGLLERIDVDGAQVCDLVDLPLMPVVSVRGTEGVFELLGECIGSGSAAVPPWPGRTVNFFRGRANVTIPAILRRVGDAPWSGTGHSLGAAVLALATDWGNPPVFLFDFGSPRGGNAAYATPQTRPRARFANLGDPVANVPFGDGPVPPIVPWLGPDTTYRHWGSYYRIHPDGSIFLPPGPDNPVAGLGEIVLDLIAQGAAVGGNHSMSEYCRRLRAGIPVAFPALVADPDFPALEILDQTNVDMNDADGVTWEPGPGPTVGAVFASLTC